MWTHTLTVDVPDIVRYSVLTPIHLQEVSTPTGRGIHGTSNGCLATAAESAYYLQISWLLLDTSSFSMAYLCHCLRESDVLGVRAVNLSDIRVGIPAKI